MREGEAEGEKAIERKRERERKRELKYGEAANVYLEVPPRDFHLECRFVIIDLISIITPAKELLIDRFIQHHNQEAYVSIHQV